MDESLVKEALANIPQRTVSHVVQGAALKIQDEIGEDDTEGYFIGEKHDELVMEVPENNWEPYAKLLKKHMETPIDFSTYCSLKRDYVLTIPCDVELSTTHYGDFKKVKLQREQFLGTRPGRRTPGCGNAYVLVILESDVLYFISSGERLYTKNP
jgi:hypothetical protein